MARNNSIVISLTHQEGIHLETTKGKYVSEEEKETQRDDVLILCIALEMMPILEPIVEELLCLEQVWSGEVLQGVGLNSQRTQEAGDRPRLE